MMAFNNLITGKQNNEAYPLRVLSAFEKYLHISGTLPKKETK